MKNKALFFLALLLLAAAAWLLLNPQQNVPSSSSVPTATAQKKGDDTGKEKSILQPIVSNTAPSQEYTLPANTTVNNPQQAQTVVNEQKPQLGLGDQDALDVKGQTADEQGNAYYQLEQTYKGLPVYGARAVLEIENGQAVLISGSWQTGLNIDVNPAHEALDAVTQALRKEMSDEQVLRIELKSETLLMIYMTNSGAHLAWRVTVQYQEPVLAPEIMIVDAQTPEILFRQPALLH